MPAPKAAEAHLPLILFNIVCVTNILSERESHPLLCFDDIAVLGNNPSTYVNKKSERTSAASAEVIIHVLFLHSVKFEQ